MVYLVKTRKLDTQAAWAAAYRVIAKETKP